MEDLLDPPVHLCIKTHRVTGLKYFGRTVKRPLLVPRVWQILGVAPDQAWKRSRYRDWGTHHSFAKLTEAATSFSIENNIVKSSDRPPDLTMEIGLSHNETWTPDDDFRRAASKRALKFWSNPVNRERTRGKQSESWTEERKEIQRTRLAEYWTPERRVKAAEAVKSNPDGPWRRALTEAAKRPKSDETKAKMNAAWTGRKKSAEHVAKMSEAATNRKHSRAPAEADFLEPGRYRIAGVTVYRTGKSTWAWKSEDESLKFRSLKELDQTYSLGITISKDDEFFLGLEQKEL